MTFSPEQNKALDAPLDKAHVKTRDQGGKTLSYVEAWHAIAEANRIFGFDGWDRETVLLTETNRELVTLQGSKGAYQQWRVGYLAKVRVTVAGIIREGTGFGSGMSKPEALGDAIESAAKEAESDAMKRALMTFGNPFGLALYDKTQANVMSAEEAVRVAANAGRKTSAQAKRDGDDAKIKAEIAKCDRNGLRDWHENFDAYTATLPLGWLDSIRDMLESRLEELAGEDRAREGEQELDAAFHGTVGRGPVPQTVAGRGDHRQGAAA